MSKIEECTYMNLYDVFRADIELNGSKIVLAIYLADIQTGNTVRKVLVSASNIATFLKQNELDSLFKLNGLCMRCLINPYREINYIGLLEGQWTICKDVYYE